jgi:hypothetical protein
MRRGSLARLSFRVGDSYAGSEGCISTTSVQGSGSVSRDVLSRTRSPVIDKSAKAKGRWEIKHRGLFYVGSFDCSTRMKQKC